MSEITENMRAYLTVKAEQHRLSDELALNLDAIMKILIKQQAVLSPEDFVAFGTQLITRTNKAVGTYVNLLTSILDQLESETKKDE